MTQSGLKDYKSYINNKMLFAVETKKVRN